MKIGDFGLVTGVHGEVGADLCSQIPGSGDAAQFSGRNKSHKQSSANHFSVDYDELSEMVDSCGNGNSNSVSSLSFSRKPSQQHTDQVRLKSIIKFTHK